MQHLCNWIAIRVPQLQRLRLSDTRVCSTMFTRIKGTCPLLDEIIIDGRTGLVPNCITHQPDFRSPLHGYIPRPFLDAFYNSQVRDSLFVKKGRVLLIGQCFVPWHETEGTFGYLYTVNCVDDITIVYRIALFCGTRGFGDAEDFEVEEGSQSEEEDSHVDEGIWMRCSIPSNGQEVDTIDARYILCLPEYQLEMLEGPNWLQLGHGSRLPHAL